MSTFKTDGFIVTKGEGYFGIHTACELLNDLEKENQELKKQLKIEREINRNLANRNHDLTIKLQKQLDRK